MPVAGIFIPRRRTKSTNDKTARNDKEGEQGTEVMYPQETLTPGDDGKLHPTIKYHCCKKHGHYLSNFPGGGDKQNLNLKEESEDDKEAIQDAGAQHLQMQNILEEDNSLSDNGSYLIDFRDFQFL